MFFHLSLEHEVCLHPKYFGPNLNETIKAKLFHEVIFSLIIISPSNISILYFNDPRRQLQTINLFNLQVEGTCTGKHGFIIGVTAIDTIGHGLIQPGRGFVTYPVKYRAIVFRPFKGQVVDTIVNQVRSLLLSHLQLILFR